MPIVDNIALLNMMVEDQNNQPQIYKPGPYWSGYHDRMVQSLRRHGIVDFRSRLNISGVFDYVNGTDPADLWHDQDSAKANLKRRIRRIPLLSRLFADYEELLNTVTAQRQRFLSWYYAARFSDLLKMSHKSFEFPPSTEGGCNWTVDLNGQAYSPMYTDFLIRAKNFEHLAELASRSSVFEIGGGFGGWTHLMLGMYPNIRKVLCLDIPPTTYIATEHLRSFYGNAVRDYASTRGQEKSPSWMMTRWKSSTYALGR